MKRINFKKFFIILGIFWFLFLTTDIILSVNQKDPLFAYPTVSIKDGGSKYFTGLFYTVHKKIHNAFTENCYFTYSIYPWFFDAFFGN